MFPLKKKKHTSHLEKTSKLTALLNVNEGSVRMKNGKDGNILEE